MLLYEIYLAYLSKMSTKLSEASKHSEPRKRWKHLYELSSNSQNLHCQQSGLKSSKTLETLNSLNSSKCDHSFTIVNSMIYLSKLQIWTPNAFFNFVIHTADVRVIHHSYRKWLRLSPVSPERQKEHDNQIDHTWRNQNIHQSFSTLTTLKNLKTRHQHPKLSNSLKRQNYPMVENPTIRICSSTTCVNSIAKKRLT